MKYDQVGPPANIAYNKVGFHVERGSNAIKLTVSIETNSKESVDIIFKQSQEVKKPALRPVSLLQYRAT